MKVLSVGEVLWDVFPDREFLGGAPLNVCANLRRAGDEAVLLSAVGDDVRGRAVLDAMNSLGLSTRFMQVVKGAANTGLNQVQGGAAQDLARGVGTTVVNAQDNQTGGLSTVILLDAPYDFDVFVEKPF